MTAITAYQSWVIDAIKVDMVASGFITPAEACLLMVYAGTSKYYIISSTKPFLY
jgi:hypothetical protein